MLTKIEIQGFKSLYDVEVPLGQVNVFVGANGSGKTNLLEAVGFLGAAASRQVDDQALSRRGVRLSVPQLYQSSFHLTEISSKVTLGATQFWQDDSRQGDVEYRVEFDPLPDVRTQPWPYKEALLFNNEPVIGPQIADITTILSNYAIFSPNTPVLRGITPDITQRQPIGLSGGQLANALDELLHPENGMLGDVELDELFELLDWVDSIAITPASNDIVSPSVPTTRSIVRFTDRWMSLKRNQLSAYDASEGALYVLFAMTLALHPYSPQFFAIDNFDQAMHPRLARATMRLFCKKLLSRKTLKGNSVYQVLLTTHNPLVLDGLNLRDDRIRLFAVERNTFGATQVHRVQVSEEVLEATQAGLSLSNLWVMGRLGGVPDIF